MKSFVADYFDRGAQARHAGEHPDSQLLVIRLVFTTKYFDPNNPSTSGDLLALSTGGKVTLPQRHGVLRGGGLISNARPWRTHLVGLRATSNIAVNNSKLLRSITKSRRAQNPDVG